MFLFTSLSSEFFSNMPRGPDDGEVVPDVKVVGYAPPPAIPNPENTITSSRVKKSRHDPSATHRYVPGSSGLNRTADVNQLENSRTQFAENVVMQSHAVADALEIMSRSQHPSDVDSKLSQARETILSMLQVYDRSRDSAAIANSGDFHLLAPPNSGHPNSSRFPYNAGHPSFTEIPRNSGQPDISDPPFHIDIGQHVFSNLLSHYGQRNQDSAAQPNRGSFDAAIAPYWGQPDFSDVPSHHRKRKHDSAQVNSSGNLKRVAAPKIGQPDFTSSPDKKIGQSSFSAVPFHYRERNKDAAAITNFSKPDAVITSNIVQPNLPNVSHDGERTGDSTEITDFKRRSEQDPYNKHPKDLNYLPKIGDYYPFFLPEDYDGGNLALLPTDSLPPDSASYFADISSNVCELDFTEKRRILRRTSRKRLTVKSRSVNDTRDELDVVRYVTKSDRFDCQSSFSSADESDNEPQIPRTKARKAKVKTRDRLTKCNIEPKMTSTVSHVPKTLYLSILKCVTTQIDHPSSETSNTDVTNAEIKKSEVLPNISNLEPPKETEVSMEVESDVTISSDTDRETLHSKTNESDSSGADKDLPSTKELDQILDSKSSGSEASGMGNDKKDMLPQKRALPLSELDDETWMKRLLAHTCNMPPDKKTRVLKLGNVQDTELDDYQSDQENTAPEIISRKRKQGRRSGEWELDKRGGKRKHSSGDNPSSCQ